VEDLLFPPAGWYGDGVSTTRDNWQSGLGEQHPNVKHSDETLRRVIAMKRAGFSTSEVSTVTGVRVHHVDAVTRGRFRGYLHDELPLGPTVADLIASCPDVGAAIRSARVSKGMTQLQ
jgi:hypothetical protein